MATAATTIEHTSAPRIHLIFNSVSGKRDPVRDLALLETHLLPHKPTVWQTTAEIDGYQLAQKALSHNATHIVACGGDGTVTSVAGALVAHPSPPLLGVVPRGTANALCAALHIPTDLKKATEMITAEQGRLIDVAVVHVVDRPPVNMLLLCGIGLEAETIKKADRGLKRSFGAAAYALAGILTTWENKKFVANLVLYDVYDSLMFGGGTLKSDVVRFNGMKLRGLTVANAAPATSVMAQGIGAVRPDDGYLEVVCVTSRGPWHMIMTMVWQLLSGLLRRRQRRGNVFGLRAKRVCIECDPPQRIVVDGEEAGMTPVEIRLDGTVNVIAPDGRVVDRRGRRVSRALVRLWRNVKGVAVFLLVMKFAKRKRQMCIEPAAS